MSQEEKNPTEHGSIKHMQKKKTHRETLRLDLEQLTSEALLKDVVENTEIELDQMAS